MPVIESKFGMFYILTSLKWNIIMDDMNLDENSFGSDNNCNIANL